MTIEELSQDLLRLADSYQQVVVGAEEMRTLEARADELDAAVDVLRPQATSYAVLVGSGLAATSAELAGQSAATARTIAGAQRAFDPTDGGAGRADIQVFANAVEQAKRLALALAGYNRVAWDDAKARELPPSDEALVRVLVRLTPWRHLAQRFADLSARLRQARDASLPSQANAELVRTASTDLRSLRDEVASTSSGVAVPPEVVRLLQVVSTDEGAPFAFLTPAVMQWLEDNDVSSSLSVVVSDS